MNSFGQYLRLTSFGESHGPAMGGVLDGMPAGIEVDMALLERALARRSPSTAAGSTARREPDAVELLSGIYKGRTLGTPIGFIIRNKDRRSADYENVADAYRPNHADFTYQTKYGHRDPRGGGRASARETVSRVVAGAFAEMLLNRMGIRVLAWTAALGQVKYTGPAPQDEESIYSHATRCPSDLDDAAMKTALDEARNSQDTLGGVVECRIEGVPAGLGDPVGDKLQALLAGAMLSIPAAKGFEYGDGFAAAGSTGSRQVDTFYMADGGEVRTRSNHSGGIQGGISNGMPISFRVAFKPIATIPGRPLETVDTQGRAVTTTVHGRHDVSAVPRAVAVVKAMACMVLANAVLASRLSR